MNFELIKTLLIISISSSILSTTFMQRIKESNIFKSSDYLIYISFLISMIFGILFTLTFTEYSLIYSLWVGLFSFLEADTLYKAFEDKVFKSFSTIHDITEIKRGQ